MGISLFDSTVFIWLVFLGVVVPIFTLGISLMSHVIDRSKQEIQRHRVNTEKKLTEEILLFEKALQQSVKEDNAQDIKDFEEKLAKVRRSKEKFERETDAAIKSYDILNFRDSVLIPGIYFFLAIVFSLLISLCVLPRSVLLSSCVALFFILMGIYRVSKSLNVVRAARLTFDRFERERMSESFCKIFSDDSNSLKKQQ